MMALHGDIRVNGESIGFWDATRVVDDVNPGVHEYRASVVIRGLGVVARVTHRYDDGPAALASKVLALWHEVDE